jgi:hypothetical protein
LQLGDAVLHLRRPDEKAPDGATWNFPAADSGSLTLRFMLPSGSAGGSVALVDRFFDPTDDAGEAEAMLRVPLAPGGSVAGQPLGAGTWHTLELSWDAVASAARVRLDGAAAGTLPFARPTATGLSYLRLRSTAANVDAAGWMVESVRVRAGAP